MFLGKNHNEMSDSDIYILGHMYRASVKTIVHKELNSQSFLLLTWRIEFTMIHQISAIIMIHTCA